MAVLASLRWTGGRISTLMSAPSAAPPAVSASRIPNIVASAAMP